jgi:hypothetical protein
MSKQIRVLCFQTKGGENLKHTDPLPVGQLVAERIHGIEEAHRICQKMTGFPHSKKATFLLISNVCDKPFEKSNGVEKKGSSVQRPLNPSHAVPGP